MAQESVHRSAGTKGNSQITSHKTEQEHTRNQAAEGVWCIISQQCKGLLILFCKSLGVIRKSPSTKHQAISNTNTTGFVSIRSTIVL